MQPPNALHRICFSDEAKKETKPCPTTPKPDTNNSTPTSLKLMVVVIFLTIVIFILIGALIIVIYACRYCTTDVFGH